MSRDLRIDISNLLADAVGEQHGATEADLAELERETPRVHAELQEARANAGLEFSRLPELPERLEPVEAVAKRCKGRFRDVVVLGIGGSALGTIAVHTALHSQLHTEFESLRDGRPRLRVVDNVDPEWIHDLLENLAPETTLVNVISKSGSTAETAAQFLVFREWLRRSLGDGYRDHLVITTDASKGSLREICHREGIASLEVPDGVGGRFSVLTPVGLFPLAMVGIDLRDLLRGAGDMYERCAVPALRENPAYLHGALLYCLERTRGKSIHVLMPYAQALRDLADWFRQLWAESLGKRVDRDGTVVNVGPTPVKSLGTTDQHSQLQLYSEGPFDKIVTFLRVESFRHSVPIPAIYGEVDAFGYLGGKSIERLIDAELQGTRYALTQAARPNSTIHFPAIDAHTVGQFLMLMEMQTAFVGGLYRIDAFDQPGVEASKEAAYALLGRAGYEGRRREIESSAD